jgi:iron complex outermembrane recepter protein
MNSYNARFGGRWCLRHRWVRRVPNRASKQRIVQTTNFGKGWKMSIELCFRRASVPVVSLGLICCGYFSSAAIAADSPAGSNGTLNEIIVTAEKREERLQDVPIPVTVVSAEALVQSNEVRIQDFYSSFPGLAIAVGQQSSVTLLVRGLTGGLTVDDVPLGGASGLGGGLAVDLDPAVLAQVEVLRGPQGTLYGANSEGGLLRYVTADPSTDGISGRVEAGASSVYNGADPGYNFRGSVNLPISADLALLASGFERQDPGYIDNPVLGAEGINRSHTYGGHLALLWRPSDTFSFKLGAFIQESKGDGTNDVDVPTAGYPQTAGLGGLQQNYIRGAGPYDRTAQLYTAILKFKFGIFDLTSVSGYQWSGYHDSFDATVSGLGAYAQNGIPGTPFNGFGQPGLLQLEDEHNSIFSQEVRLSAQIGHIMDVLFGGFYSYDHNPFDQYLLSSNPSTGAIAGNFSYITSPVGLRSYAAFTNLTYHVTDQFDIQLGGREEYDLTTSYGTTFSGPGNYILLYPSEPSSPPYTSPAPNGESHAFTYLVTPRYKVSPDLMIYARAASGYHFGGPNIVSGPGIPAETTPDTVNDYEVGTKGELPNHILTFDADVYYIKHKNIQVSEQQPVTGIQYGANGGSATSEGVELSTELRPVTGLTVTSWVAWNVASLSKDIPPNISLYPNAGQTLPLSPRFSGNLSVDQQFPLVDKITGFVGGTVTFVGDRLDQFQSGTAARKDLPAYTKTDLHAGIHYADWTTRLYANNIANRRGVISGDPQNIIPYSYSVVSQR